MIRNYDNRAESIPCAVRAVWTLYKRGKWSLLEEMGIDRKQHETLFFSFEEHSKTPTVSGLLSSWSDIVVLIRLSSAVLDAALELSNEYYLLYHRKETRFC